MRQSEQRAIDPLPRDESAGVRTTQEVHALDNRQSHRPGSERQRARREEMHDPAVLAPGRPDEVPDAADCSKRAGRDVVPHAELDERSLDGPGLAQQDVRRKRATVEAFEQPRQRPLGTTNLGARNRVEHWGVSVHDRVVIQPVATTWVTPTRLASSQSVVPSSIRLACESYAPRVLPGRIGSVMPTLMRAANRD